MQLEFVEDRSNAPKPVLRIFQRDAPDDPVDFITLLEKELGQIGSVLTGDSRNKRLSSQTTSGINCSGGAWWPRFSPTCKSWGGGHTPPPGTRPSFYTPWPSTRAARRL